MQGFQGFPIIQYPVPRYATAADFPTYGEVGILYLDQSTNILYSYSPTTGLYIATSADLSAYLPLAGGTMTGQIKGAKGTIASAATTDLGTAGGNYVVITGTTTITSFGTVAEGTQVTVEFADSLTLTYNATTMILPGADDIVTIGGDTATFVSEGGGAWRCTNYHPQSNWFNQRGSATVGNTTTETTLIGTGSGNRTIPVNWLAIAHTYNIAAWGFITNTGTPTIRIRLKFGSTTLADTTAVTMGTITGTMLWRYEGVITCRTIGGTGTVFAQGEFSYYASTSSKRTAASPSTATVTVDTTATNQIDLTAQWGTASASNTLTSTNLSIYEVP